jgi:hypothetical protein
MVKVFVAVTAKDATIPVGMLAAYIVRALKTLAKSESFSL